MERYDFLSKIPLFKELPENQMRYLCENLTEVTLQPGELLFAEGSSGDSAYAVMRGQIEVIKQANNREILLSVRGPGEVIGEMALLEETVRMAGIRAREETHLIVIRKEQMDYLLENSLEAVRAMFFTVLARLRSTQSMLNQSEKMAQLGTLTAGVAHELNNPAAAVQRGTKQLSEVVGRYSKMTAKLDSLAIDARILAFLEEHIRNKAEHPIILDALERSDREYAVEMWLEQQGIAASIDFSAALVNLDYTPEKLDSMAETFANDELLAVMDWMTASYAVYDLLNEVHEGAARISEIIKGLKNYTYLDQAPVQMIHPTDGIESTLIILRRKLTPQISVEREYEPNLPQIEAYGSELNQVWTNILDNALAALNGKGRIIIRSRREGKRWVVIEIEDNGPGIPIDAQGKVFDSFFTLKAPGQGTGLGLDISYKIILKHKGDIKLFSEPGKTCFQVWLPVPVTKNLGQAQS